MIIKRTINFYPNKDKERNGYAPLRCYVRFNSQSLVFNLGYNVTLNGWNTDTQRCKRNTYHDKQNIPATHINKIINSAEELINECFTHFEEHDIIPTKEELKELIDIKTGKKKAEISNPDDFFSVYDKYIRNGINNEKWAYNTLRMIKHLRNLLYRFNPRLKLSDFDNPNISEQLTAYFLSCGDGYTNSTIIKRFRAIKTFLNWCVSNRYLESCFFTKQRITLKNPRNTIIFLTWDELMKVYNHDFTSTPHLNSVRDVFCFCCFTSLRYSDVANLKAENITEDKIHFTTIKTADTIDIELNKYSRAILDKYKGQEFPKGRVLPVISNQKMNDYLKDMAKACEIDSPVTITTYKGNRRIDSTVPKYELISSHAGRRTFISNAIMLGIAPEIVMKWSGHSDYNAMKPYIEIANEAKKQAMSIFDKL